MDQQGIGYESRLSTATSLTFSQKSPWGAAHLLSSSFGPNLADPPLSSICTSPLRPPISSLRLSAHQLPLTPLRPIHSLMSPPPVHSWPPDRAANSWAGRDHIVSECEDENGRKKGEAAWPLEEQRAVLGSASRTGDRGQGQAGSTGPTGDCSVCFRTLILRFKRTPSVIRCKLEQICRYMSWEKVFSRC